MPLSVSAPLRRRPIYHPLILLRMLVISVVAIYVLIGVYLACIQTNLIYGGYSPTLSREVAFAQARKMGLVPWPHSPGGVANPQGFVQPDFETSQAPRGTVVFFHGNGEPAYLWIDYLEPFRQRGFRVFFYEYPGYGGRPGVPSEKTIVPDAQALVRDLAARGFGPNYIWGTSLGAGVASAVCADATLPVKGLVLTSPWDTIANVGFSHYPIYPVGLLLRDKYDSVANLQNFKGPVCVIRGDQDETIVPKLTLNLFDHLNDPKKMILKTGYGHLGWPDDPKQAYWDEALDFIAPK